MCMEQWVCATPALECSFTSQCEPSIEEIVVHNWKRITLCILNLFAVWTCKHWMHTLLCVHAFIIFHGMIRRCSISSRVILWSRFLPLHCANSEQGTLHTHCTLCASTRGQDNSMSAEWWLDPISRREVQCLVGMHIYMYVYLCKTQRIACEIGFHALNMSLSYVDRVCVHILHCIFHNDHDIEYNAE